ncbi:hypothetical protein [Brevundimonas sp.]|uniref:hypothetical protein n=1 Tax=Brevundimonas sp. TaxID=1871086 RepID=UPI002D41EAE1|nr:hypothetical protein [Brevundimonas sp.]HYD27180.1 hypothetical protein [Brevundimonas sp.]
MATDRSPLDAFDEAPSVTACGGEVVISGSLVNAAYTVEAARVLLERLTAAVEDADRQRAA